MAAKTTKRSNKKSAPSTQSQDSIPHEEENTSASESAFVDIEATETTTTSVETPAVEANSATVNSEWVSTTTADPLPQTTIVESGEVTETKSEVTGQEVSSTTTTAEPAAADQAAPELASISESMPVEKKNEGKL